MPSEPIPLPTMSSTPSLPTTPVPSAFTFMTGRAKSIATQVDEALAEASPVETALPLGSSHTRFDTQFEACALGLTLEMLRQAPAGDTGQECVYRGRKQGIFPPKQQENKTNN